MMCDQVEEIDTEIEEDIEEILGEETIEAMRECDEILAHPENYKWYDSVDEMMADILNEPDDD